MPSDYARIRRDNLREYGEGVRHLAYLGKLYADRTHFLFELLQNAEDAEASTVRFDLYEDRLEVRHDGRLFTERDVRGICGVGEGAKADDLTQIGKFGIGFKSVYAYTTCPQVHSGHEHFQIDYYVRPSAIRVEVPGRPWTTRFVFTFNHPSVPPSTAYREIEKRLQTLSARTLLFLRHISSVSWYVVESASGTYIRDELERSGSGRWVRLTEDAGGSHCEEHWLVFERPIEAPGGAPVRVEAGFRVESDEQDGRETIVRADAPYLVVFFPTEKETHLGFLLQGPYQTTPARDNVPIDSAWNQHLVQQSADLVSDCLPVLRDMGLMSVNLLDALPIRAAHFPEGSMFRPVYDAVREALRTERLLPTTQGDFASAAEVKLARSAGLIDLFDPHQLGKLMGSRHALYWLDEGITLDRVPDLYRYLVGHRARYYGDDGIEALVPDLVVEAETVVRRLRVEFLSRQSDSWMLEFYRFLGTQPSLRPLLRTRPILRLEDLSHVAPVDSDGRPIAYLPPPEGTSFPIVRRALARDPRVLDLLRGLGLTEPDLTTEVIEGILPRYEISGVDEISERQHRRDIETIFSVLARTTGSAREHLLARLADTPFLRAENAGSGDTAFYYPSALYLRTAGLEEYFTGNAEAWFIDEDMSVVGPWIGELELRGSVPVDARPVDAQGYVIVRDWHGSHVRGLKGFDPDCSVEGLEYALKRITVERALFIWNEILLPHHHLIRGEVETSGNRSYRNAAREERLSAMGKLVTSRAWLPSIDGGFHRPEDLDPEDLPGDFRRDDALASALGMRVQEMETAARVVGITIEDIQFVRRHREQFKRFKAQLERRRIAEEETAPPDDDHTNVAFAAALAQGFDRPGATTLDEDSEITESPVPRPAERRARIEQEIRIAQKNGALTQHFSRVPRTRWEAKDSRTRAFLEAEYGGHCQICGETFAKVDGQPYFEGLYLVSRLKQEWLDRPGNVLCLCATCAAKLQFGAVEADGLIEQILDTRLRLEGGDGHPQIRIKLLGKAVDVRFTERHMLDLQEMVTASA